MSLGRRSARHDTARVQKVAVDSSIWWEYKPQQRVMTIDGIAGIVTAVLDGPHPGSEAYEVRLDDGMGGGQYTASQLSSAANTTASHEHEATGLHLASDDYEELRDILHARPPIERVEHLASRPFAREAVSWDSIGEEHPDVYGDREVHGEHVQGDGEGIGYAANHLAHDHPDDPGAENSGSWDLDFHEEHVDPKHIDYARHGGLNDSRVRHAHEGYQKDGGKSIPPVVLVHRHGVYQVADGHHRAEAAHLAGHKVHAYVAYSPHPDEPFSDGDKAPFHGAEPHPGLGRHHAAAEPPTGEQAEQDLPPCSYCGNPALAISGDNGRNVQATCGACQATMSSWGGQFTPELIGDPSNHPSQQPDKDSGGVGGAGNLYGPQPIRQMNDADHSASLRRVAEEDYRMQHQPPDAGDGVPLHDLAGNNNAVYPDDIYTHTHYYAQPHEADTHESISAMHQARGKPNKKVKIYRAMPADSVHHGIQTGNWVTTSKEYARGHGRHHEDSRKDWPVISATVEAQHLRTDGNDLREYGYHGPKIEQHGVAFAGGHEEKVSARADGSVAKVQRKANPFKERADSLKSKGYSFSHYRPSSEDNPDHHVVAYDREDNWAGQVKAHRNGEVHHTEIDPEHAHEPLEEHMRDMIARDVKKTGSLSFLAGLDSETLFHFTATWADVRSKAKRLRAEGSVRITVASGDGIGGEVKGEHNIYETVLSYVPGSQKIAYWTCGCKWAAYAWGRSPAYKRFEGRMCSHALAMQFEAQARGMFGKTVMPDETRPKWMRQRTPVVIQHERDTGKDLTRRAVPPGNMRRTFEGALVDETPPIVHLARFALSEGAEPVEVMRSLLALGYVHADAQSLLKAAHLEGPAHRTKCPDCGSPISSRFNRCPHCGAHLNGHEPTDLHEASRTAAHVTCGECEGAGTIEHEVEPTDEEAEDPDHVPGTWHETCDVCDGSGKVDLDTIEEPEESPRDKMIREHVKAPMSGAPHGVDCPPFCPVQKQMSWEDKQKVRTEWRAKHGAKSEVEGPTHAGVVLKARDTGRILMLQRNLEDEEDPAAGTWEFPGGGIEDGDTTALHAGIREWEEEVGQKFPTGGSLHHVWHSPNGVYHGHVIVIPEERQVALHDGRVTTNPDDPDGKTAEQAAWWEPEHAKKNPALRPECKSSPWKDIAKAGGQKTAAAWDPLEELAQPHTPPLHSESENPGSTGFATAQDPPEFDHPTMNTTLYGGAWGSLHDQPEPALPSTDGEDYGDDDGDHDDPAMWAVEQHPATHDTIDPTDSTATPQQFTGSVEDIVARFQATAGAQAINAGRPGTAGPSEGDIAGAAKAFLEKTALKNFNFQEQQELITEGALDNVMARNSDRLDITDTHYHALEAALAAEEAVADPDDIFA